MSFVTKTYTISLLMSEVQKLSNRQASSFQSIVSSLSPRAGSRSAKIAALTAYVGGNVSRVLGNSNLGRTPKARLLSALRARRNYRSTSSA